MSAVELLLADADNLALSALLQPSWGVYLNGSPVIQPATLFGQALSANLQPIQQIASLFGASNIMPALASTVDFEFAADSPISNAPQEEGAFQAYDKVTLPFDIKLRLAAGGSVSNRQAFLNTCIAIRNSFALFDVVTPEMVFTSVNCTHLDWRRSAERGATLLQVDLWFQQVPVTATATFTNTKSPQDAGPQALGNVQPQTPEQRLQQSFQAFAVN